VADARPNSAEQEAELARRFRNGDPAALRAAYDRHGRAVFALALLALEAHHNAEDATSLAGASDVRSRAPTWAAGWRDHPPRDRRPPSRPKPARAAARCGAVVDDIIQQQISAFTGLPAGNSEKPSPAEGWSGYNDGGRSTVPHPAPDQLALAALPAEPVEPEIAAHVAMCPTCHAELASLRHTVDLARATHPATDTGPPSRVWHAINGELAAPPRNPR
jgi:hypothetical protein